MISRTTLYNHAAHHLPSRTTVNLTAQQGILYKRPPRINNLLLCRLFLRH